MAEHRPAMSEAERDVLKVLWDRGLGTVREIHQALIDQGRSWAYTTVTTLLQRLEAKGYVTSDKSSFAHVFRAALTRDDVVRQQLADMADEFCDGTAAPLMLALVQGQRFSAAEIEEFRRVIDALENQKPRTKPASPRRRDRGDGGK